MNKADENPRSHFVIHLGLDKFDVIFGHKLNEEPLSLDAANRLARRASASAVSVTGHLVSETRP